MPSIAGGALDVRWGFATFSAAGGGPCESLVGLLAVSCPRNYWANHGRVPLKKGSSSALAHSCAAFRAPDSLR